MSSVTRLLFDFGPVVWNVLGYVFTVLFFFGSVVYVHHSLTQRDT